MTIMMGLRSDGSLPGGYVPLLPLSNLAYVKGVELLHGNLI